MMVLIKIYREIYRHLLLIWTIFSTLDVIDASKFNDVTCGSVVKLQQLSYKIRLHSHEVKYGSGSGQQSVTGVDSMDDANSNWLIKAITDKYCTRGESVKCGDKIRLEHLSSGRNLHSHLFTSPLSNSQEVSAFGENGKGDTGDHWQVVCEGNSWKRDQKVLFKHLDTQMYLAASGHTFGRPIHGQMEICAIYQPDATTYWQTAEGVFMKPSASNTYKQSHDEL